MNYIAVPIAVIVALVGLEQYFLARERFKLDLFEKRFAIFKSTETFISAILVHGVSIQIIQQFNSDTRTAIFLFDQKVINFLEDIRQKASDYLHCNIKANDKFHPPDKKDLQDIEKRQADIVMEFNLILQNELKDKFSRYLKFSEWKYGFIWRIFKLGR